MSAGHDHSHAPASFNAAFGIGIALNLAFVAVEAFYGWKIDSLALLADAGHNLSDVIGLVLAWGGALAGRLRPDARHTYGWKRASILAAFVNALLLLVAMGSLAWEAVHRLQSPQPVDGRDDHGGGRHRHRRQHRHRAAVHARSRAATSTSAAPSCTWRPTRWSRPAWWWPAAWRCGSAGPGSTRWSACSSPRVIVVGHLEPVPPVAAPAVRRRARARGPARGAVAAAKPARRGAGARPARVGHGHHRDRAHRAPGDARGRRRRRLPEARHRRAARALRDPPRDAAGGARGLLRRAARRCLRRTVPQSWVEDRRHPPRR